MQQTGQSERMTVHAFWCDVGASHGVFRFNRIWNIAKGATGNVRVARWEARCHGWRVHDNHLWDNGGGSLWLNGYNFDTHFFHNRIERPGSACFALGGDEARRVVLRDNTCVQPGGKPLSLYGGFTEAQVTQEGNSWQQAPSP